MKRECDVNYMEFVMSGKVLLIEKAQPAKAKLSVQGNTEIIITIIKYTHFHNYISLILFYSQS